MPERRNYRLYKAKKQWITACSTFMLAFGATALLNAKAQAATTLPSHENPNNVNTHSQISSDNGPVVLGKSAHSEEIAPSGEQVSPSQSVAENSEVATVNGNQAQASSYAKSSSVNESADTDSSASASSSEKVAASATSANSTASADSANSADSAVKIVAESAAESAAGSTAQGNSDANVAAEKENSQETADIKQADSTSSDAKTSESMVVNPKSADGKTAVKELAEQKTAATNATSEQTGGLQQSTADTLKINYWDDTDNKLLYTFEAGKNAPANTRIYYLQIPEAVLSRINPSDYESVGVEGVPTDMILTGDQSHMTRKTVTGHGPTIIGEMALTLMVQRLSFTCAKSRI